MKGYLTLLLFGFIALPLLVAAVKHRRGAMHNMEGNTDATRE